MKFEHAIVFEGGDGPRDLSKPICGNVLITLPRTKAVTRVEVVFMGKVESEVLWTQEEVYKYEKIFIE